MNRFHAIAQQAEQDGVQPIAAAIPAPEATPLVEDPGPNRFASIAADAQRVKQGIPDLASEEPLTMMEQVYQVGGKAVDYLQGAAHGILEGYGDRAALLAKAAPYIAPMMGPAAGIAAQQPAVQQGLESAAGAVGGAAMSLSPLGPEGPKTPEEILGHETSVIPEMLAGAGVVKGGMKAGQNLGLNRVIKDMVAGKNIDEIPDKLRGLSRPDGLPKGVTEKAAKQMLDDVQDAQEAATTQVLDPFMDRVMKGSIEGYRNRLLKLFDSGRGKLIPPTMQKRLMAWEGMSAKEFMNYRYLVSNKTVKPSGKFIEESAEARGRRGAYSEILNAMDSHFDDIIPPNSVLRKYGEGLQMYKVVKRWDEAKRIFSKGIDRTSAGERTYNMAKVLRQIDKLRPEKVRELFGPEVFRAVKALERAGSAKAALKRKAEHTLRSRLWSAGKELALFTGLGTLLYRTGPVQSGVREVFGAGATQGHQGMGR